MSEQELLVSIQQEPEVGFREMLDVYQKPVYFYVRKMVYNHNNADDVCQNVWIKVFKNIKTFRAESKLSTWLYRIATNEALNFLQKESKRKNISVEEVSEYRAGLLAEDTMFTGDEIELLLHKTVATLPEKQRLVFQLKYFEAKKYEEISEILDTSVGALKANYHHAVQKIKEQVKLATNL